VTVPVQLKREGDNQTEGAPEIRSARDNGDKTNRLKKVSLFAKGTGKRKKGARWDFRG